MILIYLDSIQFTVFQSLLLYKIFVLAKAGAFLISISSCWVGFFRIPKNKSKYHDNGIFHFKILFNVLTGVTLEVFAVKSSISS